MIYSYTEPLGRDVLLIRGGPEARVYPNPWEQQVIAYIVRWWEFWKTPEPPRTRRGYVIFKGFSDKGTTREYMNAAIREANQRTHLPVRWMQKKPGGDSYWLFQTSGVDGKGKIIMAKEQIHKVKDSVKADKTLDWAAFEAGLAHYKSQEMAGHYSTKNFVASETPDPSNPKLVHVSVTFDRLEN